MYLKRIARAEKEANIHYEAEINNEDDVVDDKAAKMTKNASTPPKLFLGYFLMVACRTLIEALFMVGYFYVYTFRFIMPEQYQCDRAPCNNVVACYVDRPKQKTIIICLMFAGGCVTVLVRSI